MSIFTKSARLLLVGFIPVLFLAAFVSPGEAQASVPTIVNVTSGAGGYYKDGDTISITVEFSEAVEVTGGPFLNLNTGGIATYVSGSLTNTLTFEYTVFGSPNVSELDLVADVNLNGNSATIKDEATLMDDADLTTPLGSDPNSLASNTDIVIDNTPPQLQSAVISGEYTVRITFTEPVLNNTINEYTNFGGSLSGQSIVDASGTNGTNYLDLIFSGPSLLNLGNGSIDISNVIMDYTGNHYVGATNVIVSQDIPYVTEVVYNDVDNSGEFSATDTIAVRFNREMNPDSISVANVDTRLGLSNGHSFAASGPTSVAWNANVDEVVVTLGSGTTVDEGDTINPTADVVTPFGSPDATGSSFTLTTDVWYAEFWNYGVNSNPDFDFLLTPSEAQINLSGLNFVGEWSTNSPAPAINDDHFTGYLKKTTYFTAGTYHITINSDDSINVLVDSGLMLNAWGGVYYGTSEITLSEGYHTIEMYYAENDGYAHIYFEAANTDVTTEAPVLIAPVAGSYPNNAPFSVSFTLPEVLYPGSLTLTFTPSTGSQDRITFSLRDANALTTNTFTFTPSGGFDQVNEIIQATSLSLPNETYEVTLAYQDFLGNPAATVTVTDIVITDPTPTLGGGIVLTFAGGAGYVPPVATSLGIQNNMPSDCQPGYKYSPSTGKICFETSMTLSEKKPFLKDLRRNMDDMDVMRLQQYLNTHGFPVATTGPGSLGQEVTTFGAKTVSALSKLQAAKGISPALGFFGPKTRAWVNANL